MQVCLDISTSRPRPSALGLRASQAGFHRRQYRVATEFSLPPSRPLSSCSLVFFFGRRRPPMVRAGRRRPWLLLAFRLLAEWWFAHAAATAQSAWIALSEFAAEFHWSTTRPPLMGDFFLDAAKLLISRAPPTRRRARARQRHVTGRADGVARRGRRRWSTCLVLAIRRAGVCRTIQWPTPPPMAKPSRAVGHGGLRQSARRPLRLLPPGGQVSPQPRQHHLPPTTNQHETRLPSAAVTVMMM